MSHNFISLEAIFWGAVNKFGHHCCQGFRDNTAALSFSLVTNLNHKDQQLTTDNPVQRTSLMAESKLPSEKRGKDPRQGGGWWKMCLSEEELSEYVLKKASKWYSQHRNNMQFTVLLIGETGSGKSTLINNFAGEEVAPVGHSWNSETSEINKYSMTINGVNLVIYDSPGDQDSREGEADQEHMAELRERLESNIVDLVIFCYKISNNRLTRAIQQTFRTYHNLNIPWERTIFAITFANTIDTVQQLVANIEDGICTFLKNDSVLQLSDETVGKIAFCPTGDNPKLHLVNYSPGEKYDWFTHLWFTALERLDPESMIALLELRHGKMKRLFHSRRGNGRNAQQQATGDNVFEALSERYEDKWGPKLHKLLKKIKEYIMHSSPDSPEETHSAPPEREQEQEEATIESGSDSEREGRVSSEQ